MKTQISNKRLDQVAVKAVASLMRNVAEDAINARCFGLMHQPKEPKNLAKRLQAMQKT